MNFFIFFFQTLQTKNLTKYLMTENNDQVNYNEEETPEYLSRLESDYDKLLLENANLTRRISQYINVCHDILEIANTEKPQKKTNKSIYGTKYEQSFNSLNDIPFVDLRMQAPQNYYDPPTTYE